MSIDAVREDIDRLSYLAEVYEDLKLKAARCRSDEAEGLKGQLELAKKEIIALSYNIHRHVERLA